jgi:hypothetical protein
VLKLRVLSFLFLYLICFIHLLYFSLQEISPLPFQHQDATSLRLEEDGMARGIGVLTGSLGFATLGMATLGLLWSTSGSPIPPNPATPENPPLTNPTPPPAPPSPKGEGEWRLLDPITYENLTVFPVVSPTEHDTGAFLTLEEGLANGNVVVQEQGAQTIARDRDGNPRAVAQNYGASVNQLVLLNRSKRPLLLLSGELVSGGKQDRIIAKDRLWRRSRLERHLRLG